MFSLFNSAVIVAPVRAMWQASLNTIVGPISVVSIAGSLILLLSRMLAFWYAMLSIAPPIGTPRCVNVVLGLLMMVLCAPVFVMITLITIVVF